MVMGFYKLSLAPTVRARGARSVGMERVGARGTLNGEIKCRGIDRTGMPGIVTNAGGSRREIFLKFDGRFPIFRDENLYIRKGTWQIKKKKRQKRLRRRLPWKKTWNCFRF